MDAPSRLQPTQPKTTRSKAEELALRRAQLERRQQRLAEAKAAQAADKGFAVGVAPVSVSASSLSSPNSQPPPSPSLNDISYGKRPPYTVSMVEAGIPPIPAVVEARERAVRMARNELQMTRAAREKAELNAAKMCQLALEGETEARQQAERRLRAEEEYTRKAALQTTIGAQRRQAATVIQKHWRGWWLRKCFAEGLAELRRPIQKVQAMWRAAKIRKTVRLAVAQHREQKDYHYCIDKSLLETEPLCPNTVLRIVDVPADSGKLGLNLDPDGNIVAEPVGEKAASLGMMPGMKLIAFQDESVDGVPGQEVSALMRATPRPWKMSFQMPDHHRHEGRTLRSMVDDIRLELGIDSTLSIVESVNKAVEITKVADAHSTLHHRCCAVCHHLGIDTENEPVKPLRLIGCLKPDYNGEYVFVGEANGRPHWQSTTGYHLWWGQGKWLLRRKFDPKNANATAFHDPPDANSEVPMGQTEWMWFDPPTNDWVSNLVDIEESDSHSLKRGGMLGRHDSLRRPQLDFEARQPEPEPEPESDVSLQETAEDEELPSTMSIPAGAQMACRVFKDPKGRWDGTVKTAAEFLKSLRGCVMDVKAHIDTSGQSVVMILYDPKGKTRERVNLQTTTTKALNVADALKKLNSKSSLGLVSLSLTPKSGGVSADRKTLQQLVCTGAPARVPYTVGYPIKSDFVGSYVWEEAVKQCQERCNVITAAGGVIVDVDMVGADTSVQKGARGTVKWGNGQPCVISILYSEAGGEVGNRVIATLTQTEPVNPRTADVEKILSQQLTELCNKVRRRFICSSFAINTINVNKKGMDVCSLLVIAHETLRVPQTTQASTKQLSKNQIREMVRITLEILQIPQSDVSNQWIDDLFDRYDADKSGYVDDEEWETIEAALKVEVDLMRHATGSA